MLCQHVQFLPDVEYGAMTRNEKEAIDVSTMECNVRNDVNVYSVVPLHAAHQSVVRRLFLRVTNRS